VLVEVVRGFTVLAAAANPPANPPANPGGIELSK
jgi:hypothetical protein